MTELEAIKTLEKMNAKTFEELIEISGSEEAATTHLLLAILPALGVGVELEGHVMNILIPSSQPKSQED